MAGKTFQLRCTSEQAEELASALETFALAAYPPGGSECAQVASETLRDSARLIGVKDEKRPETDVGGFSVDKDGNMLLTVPVFYVASWAGRMSRRILDQQVLDRIGHNARSQ